MNRTMFNAATFALIGAATACAANKADQTEPTATPPAAGTQSTTAPHVAVNPKNPDNIIVLASSNLGYTRACVPAPAGSDCEQIAAGSFLLSQPRGFYKTPGFMDIGVFVSNDRGKTFKQIDVSKLVPPGHPEVNARGEGPIAATPDGTFFIGFNAINWGQWESQPTTFFPNGGVGVIKSTDGGMTWNWTSYSQTPADWPYGGSDLVDGTFYVTSGLAGLSTIGPRSTGLPDSPEGSIADRWISSSKDGVTWTEPQPLGGADGSGHVSGGHSSVAAAHGIVWAVVSKDGGATFSQPLKISKANSPAPPDDPDDAFSFVGDHGPSGMAMDDSGGAYVVWADWTPGERAVFFSAINVKAFEF